VPLDLRIRNLAHYTKQTLDYVVDRPHGGGMRARRQKALIFSVCSQAEDRWMAALRVGCCYGI